MKLKNVSNGEIGNRIVEKEIQVDNYARYLEFDVVKNKYNAG